MTTATPATTATMARTPARSLRDGTIAELVDLIGTALAGTGDNTAFGIKGRGTDVEVLFRDLPGDPTEALLGFVAPRDWSAIGMCVTASSVPLAPDGTVPGGRQDQSRVLLVVDRHGRHITRIHAGGELQSEPGEATGPLVDLCHRVLEMPTPVPAQSTMYLWAVLWLDRIVADFAPAGAAPNWRQITHLCPGFEVGRGVFGPRPTADQIATLGRALTAGYDWEALRELQASGHGFLPEPDPDLAGWMDEGMFARWVLALLPDLEDLVEAADALAGRGARSALTKVLRAWEVLPRAT